MKSAGRSLIFLFLLVGGLGFSQALAAEEKSLTEQMKGDLSEIKTRLSSLEERQKEIIAKEDKILEELNRVRIWVHRK
jgi:hypothetical protein